MNNKIVYLDYMATTPVDPAVTHAMQTCLMDDRAFGNASSPHVFGKSAREAIEKARRQVAGLVNADPTEIIFTSGATESINLALKGAAEFYQRQGKHIITMSTEHKAVLNTCHYLESLGFDVTYLDPASNGLLEIENLIAAIRPDTILASIMHVNNETGVIQNIAEIGKILREKGVLFHVDAAQSAGKVPIDFSTLPVDLMSLAAHKIYGPKGVGALVVRFKPRVQLVSQMQGAGQEGRVRSGTLATHQIVGMGEAFEIAQQAMPEETKRIKKLYDRLLNALQSIDGVHLNGDEKARVCCCLNVQIDGVSADKLLSAMPEVAISIGSACNSVDPVPSHVLTAMGMPRDAANQSIRISLGRFTTEHDIDIAAAVFSKKIQELR